MNGVTGSGLPALIWRDVMREAHRDSPVTPLPGVREDAAPSTASPRPLLVRPQHPATVAKQSAPIRAIVQADPVPVEATPPPLDRLRLEALLKSQ
jgi:hypothetical protein